MSYWLLKSDPETYSFEDLVRDKKTAWDGVRNYQARNNLARMKRGDKCYIYHSVKNPAVVGTAEVIKAAYSDPESDDPRWLNVDVRAGKHLPEPVSLLEIKKHPALSEMALVRQSRLSVCPMSAKEWAVVQKLAEAGRK